MAVWRTKAYNLFQLRNGAYSYRNGKVDLFADLVEAARNADASQDDELLDRIAEYVCWANAPHSDELRSAVDLAFFLPVLRNRDLRELFRGRIRDELLLDKTEALFKRP
jgi:hypothetical protein